MTKRVFLLIGFFIFTLIICSDLYSGDSDTQDINGFIYNTEDKRDPFEPLVNKEGKIVFGYGTIRSIEDIRLEGIAYDPDGDSIAIINNLVLKENDIFGNIKIIKIESDNVKLRFNQTEHVIYVIKE